MWFDSHCHLHICEEAEPVSDLLARARSSGVSRMLTVGIDIASSRRTAELASNEGVYAAVGVHPNSASGWGKDQRLEIASLLEKQGVVAVGESGLDFYRDSTPPEAQRAAFVAHIELAKGHDKALVIHTRASVTEALEVLSEVGPPDRFVFHCWSGDRDQLRRALDLGAFVSFAGNASFKSSGDLRAAAADVPASRLLVETDAPFLAPVPHRGRPNEPAFVVLVGEAIAAARGESVETLEAQTYRAACELFALGGEATGSAIAKDNEATGSAIAEE